VDDKLLPPGLYLGDCMDYMKQFPDKYFDLAVVDPPYGSGNETGNNVAKFAGGGRFGQRFDRYKHQTAPLPSGSEMEQVLYRGGYAEPAVPGLSATAKKSSRGTLPLERNTSTSFSASHAIRLSGAATISTFRQPAAFWSGKS